MSFSKIIEKLTCRQLEVYCGAADVIAGAYDDIGEQDREAIKKCADELTILRDAGYESADMIIRDLAGPVYHMCLYCTNKNNREICKKCNESSAEKPYWKYHR